MMRPETLPIIQEHFAGRPIRFLEVGIHEGWTAKLAFETVCRPAGSAYFGIDIWMWSDKPIPDSKALAIQNLAKLGVCELSHPGPTGWWMHGDVMDLVARNAISRGSLDLIYIDASHKPDATLLESTICFDLLAPGGLLLWDDYDADNPVIQEVRQAADRFLDTYTDRYEPLHRGYQLLVYKKR